MGPIKYAPIIPPAADQRLLLSSTLSLSELPFPSPAASLSNASTTPAPTNPSLTAPWPSLTPATAAAPPDIGPTAAVPESLHPMDMPALLTPPLDRPEPDMNTLVGGALAPVLPAPTTPTRPLARSNPGLQLPSFEALGIAVPRPRSVGSFRRSYDALGSAIGGPGSMGSMSPGRESYLPVGPGLDTVVLDDATTGNAQSPHISAAGGVGGLAPPRPAQSGVVRSLDPLSRGADADAESPNARLVDDAVQSMQSADASLEFSCGPSCGLSPRLSVPANQAASTFNSKSPQNLHDIHFLPLTPPQDSTDHNWDSVEPSSPTTQPSLGDNTLSIGSPTGASTGLEDDLARVALERSAGDSSGLDRGIPPAATVPAGPAAVSEESDWDFVDEVTQTLTSTVTPPSATEPSNVSCQTLPSPLSGNRHSPLYTKIMGGLQAGTPRDHGAAIRVWYLIRKGVPCGDGPVSPPATPRSASTFEEDYFTPKVYDFLARTPDYQNEHPALRGTPNNVLPLASINISVVERYIPPTNQFESRQLFDTQGLSTLVDRLTELSPNNGCLIFIYPTKTGGQTFMHQYLDPVLGPVLRSAMVVNNLSSDLSTSIGTMAAVNELDEYESLRFQLNDLCGRLSHANAATQRFHGVKAHFEVVYQSVQSIQLDRDSWTDWWTRQEKVRVRDVVTRHLHVALSGKRPLNDYGQRLPHATELSQQIMNAVETREYPPGADPVDGIEVGVFVVQRSA